MKSKIILGGVLFSLLFGLSIYTANAGTTPEGGTCIDNNCCVDGLVCENGICKRQGGIAIVWKHARVQSFEINKVSEGVYEISLLGKNMRAGKDLIMINTETYEKSKRGRTYRVPFEFSYWRTYENKMTFQLPENSIQNSDGTYTIYMWLKNWHGTGEVISVNVN